MVLENQTIDSSNFAEQEKYPWCYLYFNSANLESFLDYENEAIRWLSFDLAQKKSIPSALVYFIEINSIDKTQLNILLEIYKHYKNAHLYVFSPEDVLKTTLYKYALHVKAKMLHTLPIEKESFDAIVKNALIHSINDLRKKELLDVMRLWQEKLPFICFKENQFQWQSSRSKAFFGSKEVVPPVESFLNDSTIVLEDASRKKWKTFTHVVSDDNEATVCYFPMEEISSESMLSSLRHRFETIEWLKDRLVYSYESGGFMITVMNLKNSDLFLKKMDYLAHHEWLKELLSLMQSKVSPFDYFAQWSESCFIFCQENYENHQDKIVDFFEQLNNYNEDSRPVFSASMFKANRSLQDIIDIIDAVSEEKISVMQMQKLEITQLFSEDDDLSESEKIFRLLCASISTKAPFKLQNIYKGLCINTASKVIGEKDQMLYLECHPTQGYAANESQEVTILGESLAYDVHANVKLIDFDKRFIIVDEFRYLKSSANNRQYTRVQTRVRTPVTVKQERIGVQGEIVDISLKSLALVTRQSLKGFKQNISVKYEFRLPDETKDEGYCTIRGLGQITYINNSDLHENKLVVMLNLKNPYDSDLLRYMYMRQKELIGELKAISKTRA